MKKKWIVAVGVTIGAMVFGMAAVAAAPYVAYAQAAATATTAPGVAATAAPGRQGNGPGYGGDAQPDLPGLQESDLVISATASLTGLSVAEVNTQLQAGQSLTQIAQSKGKTAADVTSSARATLAAGLQSAVTAGTITQADADAELAEFDQRAPQMVAQASLKGPGGHGDHGGPGGPGGDHALIDAAASVTGLTDQEIDTQLQAGQTLAQIAVSKGKTADDVITAARTALTTELAADVTAGRITQAQSDASLAQFNATATQLMNDATLGQHAGGPGGHHGGPHGPGGLANPANPTPTAPAAGTTNS